MHPLDLVIAFMPTFPQGRALQRLCSIPRVLQVVLTTTGASCKPQQADTVLVGDVVGVSWQSCLQGQSLYEGTQLGCNTSLAHLGFG